jgi:GTP-binding protein
MLDATQGVTRDDHRIIQHVARAGCGVVILANKWDLLKKAVAKEAAAKLHAQIPSLTFAPVLAVSAQTGFQVPQVLPLALQVWRTLQHPPTEAQLMRWLALAWQAHAPPRFRGRVIHIKRGRWFPGRPVRLELVTTPLAGLPPPYQHYLMKQLYRHEALRGVPIHLRIAEPEKRRRRCT